jgi:hypothetical protein
MIKIRAVDLEKLYNFVVEHFLIWINFANESTSTFLKFEIWIFQTTSDGETAKTKVVDLEKYETL